MEQKKPSCLLYTVFVLGFLILTAIVGYYLIEYDPSNVYTEIKAEGRLNTAYAVVMGLAVLLAVPLAVLFYLFQTGKEWLVFIIADFFAIGVYLYYQEKFLLPLIGIMILVEIGYLIVKKTMS